MTLNPKFKKRYPKHQGKVEIQPYSGYFWARKKEKKKEEQKKKKKKHVVRTWKYGEKPFQAGLIYLLLINRH